MAINEVLNALIQSRSHVTTKLHLTLYCRQESKEWSGFGHILRIVLHGLSKP